jgi:hypothetical protein
MTATIEAAAAEDFATAVRAALSDLPPDELDELTGGLEADLLERAAESGEASWGDPVAYAEELRTAAGLPRLEAPIERRSLADEMTRMWRELRGSSRQLLARHPRLAVVSGVLGALRPAWWVFRGWSLALLIAWVINAGSNPTTPYLLVTPLSLTVLVVCVVVSVQFGRGAWKPAGSRAIVGVTNVLIALLAPFLVSWTIAQLNQAVYFYEMVANPYVQEGISVNGKYVTNVFAYDADGNLLEDVQLYDQDGDPVIVVGDPRQSTFISATDGSLLVPNDRVLGRPGWNVFPLDSVPQNALDPYGDVDADDAEPVDPPYDAVAPLGRGDGDAQTGEDAPEPSVTTGPLADR